MKKKYSQLKPGNFRVFLRSLVFFVIVFNSCRRAPDDPAKAEADIRKIEQDWTETAITGDTNVIRRILADDFLGTSPEGFLYTKRDFLNEMKANPSAFSSNVLTDIKIRFFENVAVAQGDETFTRKSGEMARFVWTDVLVQRDKKWQVVAAEDLIAPATQQPVNGLFTNEPKNDLIAIDSCRNEYMYAWLAADADHIAHVYTNDATVMYPDMPPVIGRAAILAYFKKFFAEYRQDLFELISDEVQIAGTWAFDRGNYKWKGSLHGKDQPIIDYGKYLVILQRQSNGSWKVYRDMDNSNKPQSQTTRGPE